MSCKIWDLANANNAIIQLSNTADWKKRWCIRNEDLALSFLMKLKQCPFCGSELSEEGCTKGGNNE